MEIRRILVPVDFSDHSQRALDEAIGLGKVFGAELHLLHCYPLDLSAIDPYGITPPEAYVHQLREAAEQRLDEWAAKGRAQGLRVEVHIAARSPFAAISSLAETLGVDLIVMGTRGLSGLKNLVLGSVTERTIRLAPCPVLTVKHATTG